MAQHAGQPAIQTLSGSGFTLAELLLALAILGIIATFTIPKLLSNQQNEQRNAVLKESISTLAELLHTGIRMGAITDGPTYQSYILARTNAIRICPTDSTTQGCWDTAIQGNPGGMNKAGFVLANGCTIAGIENSLNADGTDGIYLDWNGTASPNTLGEDQLKLMMCVSGTACTGIAGSRPKTAGVLGPDSGTAALYDTLFK